MITILNIESLDRSNNYCIGIGNINRQMLLIIPMYSINSIWLLIIPMYKPQSETETQNVQWNTAACGEEKNGESKIISKQATR